MIIIFLYKGFFGFFDFSLELENIINILNSEIYVTFQNNENKYSNMLISIINKKWSLLDYFNDVDFNFNNLILIFNNRFLIFN